jgi:hypothetical protein
VLLHRQGVARATSEGGLRGARVRVQAAVSAAATACISSRRTNGSVYTTAACHTVGFTIAIAEPTRRNAAYEPAPTRVPRILATLVAFCIARTSFVPAACTCLAASSCVLVHRRVWVLCGRLEGIEGPRRASVDVDGRARSVAVAVQAVG